MWGTGRWCSDWSRLAWGNHPRSGPRPLVRHWEVRALPRARDLLLALLAGTAGCIDALSYLRLGNVFTANMTGNAVLLGIATGQQVAARALHSVAALAGFVLGVLAGATLCGRRHGSEAGWPPRVTLALGSSWSCCWPWPAAGRWRARTRRAAPSTSWSASRGWPWACRALRCGSCGSAAWRPPT